MEPDCREQNEAKCANSKCVRMAFSFEALRQEARSLHDRAHKLEVLADHLERRDLPPDVDETLTDLVFRGQRFNHY